jgi:type I restriction enzyme R subunit
MLEPNWLRTPCKLARKSKERRRKSASVRAFEVSLVDLARKMRDARRRNEALGLTVEETAFYDAVAGSSDDWTADPKLAEIARALVAGIKEDLTVDWADHEATEAAIRAKIKRLLRRLGYKPPAGGGGRMPEGVVDDILEQARVLYRMWPETIPTEALS